MQSLDVEPEQVVHDIEQGLQLVPVLKLPSGQGVPEDVVAWEAMHLVRSLASWVKPDWQVMQTPVSFAHSEQPSWQTKEKKVRFEGTIKSNQLTLTISIGSLEKSGCALGAIGPVGSSRPPSVAGATAI